MKLSRHTIFVDNFPETGKHLVFNARTQAQVVVDDDLRRVLCALPAADVDEGAAEGLGQLERMGIVVQDSVDESAVLEQWFARLKSDSSVLKPTVLTTYDCNFACTYCVEDGAKSHVKMDDAVARGAVTFIKSKITATQPEKVFLTFYGGEPLLNPGALRLVARELREVCRQEGLPFGFGITTNGSLLKRDLVEELVSYGLQGVKITLDGTEEYHDVKRPYRSGRGSFADIMRNIHDVIDRVSVDIGGNFDASNVQSFHELLEYLESQDLRSKLNRVVFKPIGQTIGDRASVVADADIGCAFFQAGVTQQIIDLRRAVLEAGFRADPGVGINVCGASRAGSSFIIDPSGTLYRCPAFVGRPEFSVGDIWEGERAGDGQTDLWRRCADCAYVPLCGDGCIFAAYVRFGDVTRLNCQKEDIEFLVRENLKLNYLFRAQRQAT